jgi:hypothetical protein
MKDNKITIDVFLVFSTQADYDTFEQKDSIKHLILSKEINEHSQDKHFQVSAKHFLGYTHLITQPYEYIITLDGDFDIIPENFTNDKIMSKIHAKFSNKRIYGATPPAFGDIVKKIATAVFKDTTEYNKISVMTKDFTLYSCWTDLPVIKRSDILEFLSFIKYDKMQLNGKDFAFESSFDAVYYDIFLILHRGFRMLDINTITVGLEHDPNNSITTANYKDIFTQLKAEKYVPGWIHNRIFNLDPAYFTSEGNFIKFHVDRGV